MRILFAAHDRGGMNALAPIIHALQRSRSHYVVDGLFDGPAKTVADDRHFKAIPLSNRGTPFLEKIVRTFKPDIIVSGTSSGITLEKRLVPIARKLGIPILAVLDAWLNYAYQFSHHPNGSFTEADLPDEIFVMDSLAKRQMIAAGFPGKRLRITGNPFFETFKPLRVVRRKNSQTAIFIDQHFSELIKKGIHEDVGYDEREVLRDVAEELDRHAGVRELILKLHPGSLDIHRYDETIAASSFKISIETKHPLEALLRSATVVVGMNSAALFEAALRGKTVVSYQPRLSRARDPLMSNHLGLSFSAYDGPSLRRAFVRALSLTPLSALGIRRIQKYTRSGATQKIITMIGKLANT